MEIHKNGTSCTTGTGSYSGGVAFGEDIPGRLNFYVYSIEFELDDEMYPTFDLENVLLEGIRDASSSTNEIERSYYEMLQRFVKTIQNRISELIPTED